VSALEQLHARRQRQAAGHFLHLFLHDRLGLALRVLRGGDDQVFEDFGFVRFQKARIDLDAASRPCR
jgi:hypothetical protein